MTPRAIAHLRRVTFVVAEDTRETRKLFDLVGVPVDGKRFVSYGNHNEHRGVESLVEQIVAHRESALLTDRGTPGISDPGALVVDAARRAGVRVVPVPGASSLTAALSVSGFPSDRFLFLGFVPRSGAGRTETWDLVERVAGTVVFFESPKRIRETAEELKNRFPAAELFFARELTKLHESLSWAAASTLDPETLPEMGEYVVALRVPPRAEGPSDPGQALRAAIESRLLPDKAWAKTVAPALGTNAKTVYDELQRARRQGPSASED